MLTAPLRKAWLATSALLVLLTLLPSLALAQAGEIKGEVIDQRTRKPLTGVEIVLDGTASGVTTAAGGSFHLTAVAPGKHQLEARLPGYVVGQQSLEVGPGAAAEIRIELVSAPLSLEQIVVSPSHYSILSNRPESLQFLDRREVNQLPHLADDLYRVLGRLPGAAGGDISAKFNVRGGEEDEVLVNVDGLEVFEPFHLKDFQSVFSIIDSEAVGSVDFLTGGFPAEYGNRLSAVIDVTTATPQVRRRTEVGASFINARVLSEGTSGKDPEDGQWLISARRGYLDFVLRFVNPGGEFKPVYYDVLGKVEHRLGERTTLSADVLAASDSVTFVGDKHDERSNASYGNGYLWLNLRTAWTSNLYSQSVLGGGRVDRNRRGGFETTEGTADVHDNRSFDLYTLKQDWGFNLGRSQFLKWGFQARRLDSNYDYFSDIVVTDPIFVGGGPPQHTTRLEALKPSGEDYGIYLADRFQIARPLTVEVGGRWDRQTYTHDDQVSPRANLVYAVSDRTSFHAGWGRFYQPQRINELQVEDGVKTFFPAELAEHRLLSFEHSFDRGLSLRIEAYQKELTHLRPRFENLFDPINLFPEAESDRVEIAPQSAEAKGVELVLKGDSGGALSWWAGYTVSSVKDKIDDKEVVRSWDQPQACTFSINYRKSDKWNFNLAGIYHTGWPTTGVTAVLAQRPDGSTYVQPTLGPRNGERFPAFHHLDFRASRFVKLDHGTFTLFLEVFNLYNRQNVCCVQNVNYEIFPDNSVGVLREYDYWLPIVPSFGLSWQF